MTQTSLKILVALTIIIIGLVLYSAYLRDCINGLKETLNLREGSDAFLKKHIKHLQSRLISLGGKVKFNSPNPEYSIRPSPTEIREARIKAFFIQLDLWRQLRWCENDVCACMGCVNQGAAFEWQKMYPKEPPITKEEYYSYCRIVTMRKDSTGTSFTWHIPDEQ